MRYEDLPCATCGDCHGAGPCPIADVRWPRAGVSVAWHVDGSASIGMAITIECDRCGALHDLEGERVWFRPDQAWHLLQALRPHLDRWEYREAADAIDMAIHGPDPDWEEEGEP